MRIQTQPLPQTLSLDRFAWLAMTAETVAPGRKFAAPRH
jgi:hypothetical protein